MNIVTRVERRTSVRDQARYILKRVADGLLREDYRGLARDGELLEVADVPFFGSIIANATHYIRWNAPDESKLYLPVERDGFMHGWRIAALPLVRIARQTMRPVDSVTELLEILGAGLGAEDCANITAYLAECQAAIEHGALCADAHGRASPADARIADHPQWHRAMLDNDRLASFADHPFYPTARAKLGFDAHDLIAYGPEYRKGFRLAWFALPVEGLAAQGRRPAVWPSFKDVGLDPTLASTHALLPFHPFMRGERIEHVLGEAGLTATAHVAPADYLDVVPTLSVRAVAVVDEPGLHLKLPLAISTLGRLNLRAIKPSTINDGHIVQSLLSDLVAADPAIDGRLLLTDESGGACHSNHRFLSYIVRRYPADLDGAEPVPVAALMAPMGDRRPYAVHLVDRYYEGDTEVFLAAFFDLLLGIHLRLAARYGIALEANQQNSILLFDRRAGLRLLLKDNDGPRIDGPALRDACPRVAHWIGRLQDERIAAADADAVAQMLITITIQLNIGFVVEGLGRNAGKLPHYRHMLRAAVERHLDILAGEGIAIAALRTALLESPHFPIKYLLRAASLETRTATGAVDVNKFYGRSAPNFLTAPARP
ncbi:Siderophore synthetase component [Sphingomonas sp. YR710]|uniref:IucA/IucC family protein n=1 Tax=Sphingomonas sp. YR710 TaxID=1882773 RepID=UPI0008921BF6|nr:IucA/IucC family protein [Sphingomonas sp. YR710]SDC82382.1 Siderophore synthetase component [Sphingomonas sp. YR710]